jgi:hypothetical protein
VFGSPFRGWIADKTRTLKRSPAFARFITQDPAGFAAGPNFYAYVGDNPIGLVDPLGLGARGAEPPNGGNGNPPGTDPNGDPTSNPTQPPSTCGGTFGFGGYEVDGVEAGGSYGGFWDEDSFTGSTTGSLVEGWLGGEIIQIGGGKITSTESPGPLQGYLGFVGTGLNLGPAAGFQIGIVGGSDWGGLYLEGQLGPWNLGAGAYLRDCNGG